jgi:branched-chain amino acid transport system substrate-binding protein
MKNKIYLISIILLVVVAIFVSYNKFDRGENVVKIGVVLPLTGNNAFAGEGMKNALNLALSKIDQTKSNHKYQLIIENCALDTKIAISATRKLINVDKVNAIISAYAPMGNAISPIAEQNKVTHIGIAFDPKIAEGKYNFVLFTTADTASRSLFDELKKRDIKTIGIYHLNNPGILAVFNAMKKRSQEYGISIVSEEQFQPGERDFRSIIVKVSSKKPQMNVLLSIPPELDILSKQLSDQGIKNQTTTIYFETTQNKSLYEGLWSIGYAKISSEFEDEYVNRFKKDITFGVPNVYDAFNLLVKAYESSADNLPDNDYIANYLQNVKDYHGVLGLLNTDSQGIIDTPTSVKIVRNGKLEFEQ